MVPEKKTNLYWRLMKSERSSAEGHEDFVTEALASVLHADEALARHFLSSLTPTNVREDENILVETQTSYPATVAGESLIDLELRTDSIVLFVENKIGASLNKYLVESTDEEDEESIDQVKKYDLVLQNLDDSHPIERHLVVIGQEPLRQHSEDLQHYYRDYLWWDVYRIIEKFHEKRDDNGMVADHRKHLAMEFLRFLEITNLSPPQKLNRSGFSVTDAVRALAEAIRDVGGYNRVTRVKNETGFKIFTPDRVFEVWFDNLPTLQAFEVGFGGLKVPAFNETFWYNDASGQITMLGEIVRLLPSLERDDSAPIPMEAALDQFRNRSLAESILEHLLEEWPQSPRTGRGTSKTKEITFVAGRIGVRLSPYASEHVSIDTRVRNKGLINLARQLVKDILDYSEPLESQKKAQINLPLDLLVEPDTVSKLMRVLKQLANPEAGR
jgi:hypothetical protein